MDTVFVYEDIYLLKNYCSLGYPDKSLLWVEGDAEALCFEDSTVDGYTIAFGIRNVTHIEKALAEAYRCAHSVLGIVVLLSEFKHLIDL